MEIIILVIHQKHEAILVNVLSEGLFVIKQLINILYFEWNWLAC